MAPGGTAKAVPYIAVPCVVVLALLTGECKKGAPKPAEQPQETVVPVGAVAAQRSAIRAMVHASGVVAPSEGGEFLVVAPEPARIVEVTKMQGDAVKSGEVLARFELPSAVQNVNRLAADLSMAQAQLESARVNQTKVRDFVERGLVPRRDFENADRELTEAQATVERMRTAHTAAEAAAARASVRAPFDGIVVMRLHNPGDLVLSTNDPVLRIVDPKRVEVIASVPRKDASRVVTGTSARIPAAAGGGLPVRLTVAARLPERATADDTLPFRLVFADPNQLPVDTRVEIDIDAEERTDTVLVPAEAIIREGTQAIVVVANGSRAERRAVTTGLEDLARVEITSGLKAGELVITRGHVGLADGAAISVAAER